MASQVLLTFFFFSSKVLIWCCQMYPTKEQVLMSRFLGNEFNIVKMIQLFVPVT